MREYSRVKMNICSKRYEIVCLTYVIINAQLQRINKILKKSSVERTKREKRKNNY